jgi:DeoR/GlpR family transcriptional regulator of sugar metabolism
MWKAYEDTLNLIKQAPPARRLQLNMALLAKASTLVGSQTPDGVSKMLAEFGNLAAEQRQLMLQAGRVAYVLADHTKFERKTPIKIMPGENIAGLIVDHLPQGLASTKAAKARWPIILA